MLAAVAAGGAVGAGARHLVESTWPYPAGAFAWATFVVNVSGCLLIGALVVVAERRLAHRVLVRPLLGVGVLGGWTTFSTYALDAQRLWEHGAHLVSAVYAGGTVLAALVAVTLGVVATERALPGREAPA